MRCAMCGKKVAKRYFIIPYTQICLCERCAEKLSGKIEVTRVGQMKKYIKD